MVGIGSNGIAVMVNGGYMPVWMPAVELAGLSAADLSPTFHVLLPDELNLEFLLMAGPLGDIVPIAVPVLSNVISLGDVMLTAGVGWFLFSAVARGSADPDAGVVSLWNARPEAEVQPGATYIDPSGSQRPVVGGSGMGTGLRSSAVPGAEPAMPERADQTAAARIREHPYVRLARDARFSGFWLAGTISVFGDRLHQIALGVMVLAVTGSAMKTGLVFLAATLPNLFLGPIAGTFVDRWNQKRVMIISDLLRAGLVLLLPIALMINVWLVYPLVFLVTTVSLFFRPAKTAILPRIVSREDLTPANGAMWTGETMDYDLAILGLQSRE